jgi:hypothetical protein
VEGAARLRFAALRAGMEFFDHAAKSAIERRYIVWMRLLSDLISVMIHCDAAVGANHWVGFSHFNNLTRRNVLAAVSQRYQPTLNPWGIRQPVLDMQDR